MKSSWFIGLVCIYIILLIFSSITENSNNVTAAEVAKLQSLTQPTGSDVTLLNDVPVIGGVSSLITNVWSYIKIVGQVLFLWFPSVWGGSWYWFYLVVILPICIAMWVSLVFILRGVHNA